MFNNSNNIAEIRILGGFAKLLKRISALLCLSVYPSSWNNLATGGRIFVKFDDFWKICPENSNFIKTKIE
jgi:hypothetical protein